MRRCAGEIIGLRARVNAGAQQPVSECDVAGDRNQQAEADVGNRLGDDRRNVRHGIGIVKKPRFMIRRCPRLEEECLITRVN